MFSTKMMYFALFCVAMASVAHGLTATQCDDNADEDDMYNAVDCTMTSCRDTISSCGGNALLIVLALLITDSLQLGLYLLIRLLLKIILKVNLLGILTLSLTVKVSAGLLNYLLSAVVKLVLSIVSLVVGQVTITAFIGIIDNWCDTYSTGVQNQCNGDPNFDGAIQLGVTIIVGVSDCCKKCLAGS